MDSTQLQFIFSLFSFVGVVGILFYIILEKAKSDEQKELVELLKERVRVLQASLYELEEKQEAEGESLKEQIISLYEEGRDSSFIEESLSVPRAKIEMVLKFHNLKKSDNWRKSVSEHL